MQRQIPIENLYYLFCYAWDHFPEGKNLATGAEPGPDIWDLFASVLIRGVQRLLRRGLDRDYIELADELSTLRGRILVDETIKRNLLHFGRARCLFDEFKANIPRNQIIKTTILAMSAAEGLDPSLRHELKKLARRLNEISTIRMSHELVRRVRSARQNNAYDFLLCVCELVHSALIPKHAGEGTAFRDITRDDVTMSAVFEQFVRNFFRYEGFETERTTIKWLATSEEPQDTKLLPVMQTDVTLKLKKVTVVIDTKFYWQALVKRFDVGQEKIRSGHLNQMYAYLKNFPSSMSTPLEGILLYPRVNRSLDLNYSIEKLTLRVKTLDLNVPWKKIHGQLIGLIDVTGSDVHASDP